MNIYKNVFSFIKHHKILSLIGVIIIAVLIFVFRPKSPPPPATQTVKRTNLVQSISVSGSVNAKKQVNLSFVSSGLVTYIGAQLGDTVTAGQTIAVLDQRTVLKNLQSSLTDYSKQRNTFDQNVDNNGGRINPTDAVNDAMKRIIQNNQYDLNKAVVSVELQDLAKQQSVLVSPINGILTHADAVTAGSSVTATSVFTIVDPSSLVFAMDVDEADIGKVTVGQQVKLNLDAYPNANLTFPVTHIDFVSHTTTNGGNAFTVEVKLPQTIQYIYRVGMNGNAEITTAEKDHVLTIPITSVVDDQYIYVKTSGKYKKKNIVLGLQSDTDAEVVKGLHEGELIVLESAKIPNK